MRCNLHPLPLWTRSDAEKDKQRGQDGEKTTSLICASVSLVVSASVCAREFQLDKTEARDGGYFLLNV